MVGVTRFSKAIKATFRQVRRKRRLFWPVWYFIAGKILLVLIVLSLCKYIRNWSASKSKEAQYRDFLQIKSLPRGPLDRYVLRYLQKYHLSPPTFIGYENKFKVSPGSDFSKELHSIFYNYSTPGFFVECGPNDGKFLSNTLHLEVNLNWTGLLVEADPELHDYLVQDHRLAWIASVCLSPFNNISEIHKTLSPWSKGESYGRYKRKTKNEVGGQMKRPSIKVPCFPLYSLLAALRVTHVDYLSLDTQGSELDILRTLPFDFHLTIDHIQVACKFVPDGAKGVKSFLESQGYKLLASKHFNYIFKRSTMMI